MRVGIFDVHGTDAQVAGYADALALIDYPWWRCLPFLHSRGQTIDVWWDEGMSGQFRGFWLANGGIPPSGSREYPAASMVLNGNVDGDPFTVAHEIGHAVDTCTLYRGDRNLLTELLHTTKPQIGHFDHDHRDAGHGSETWNTAANAYPSRLNEAFADAFVAAFAPDIWDGNYVRFVHWPADLDQFKQAVLARSIQVFADVPADHPYSDQINRLAADGIIEGFGDGTFRPEATPTRGQLAVIVGRVLDYLATR